MAQGISKKPLLKAHPLEESIGATMGLIMRSLNPLFDQTLTPFKLSHGTWYHLRALWDEDGISQRELSRRVGTAAPTTLVALRGLQAAGYVTLVSDKSDGRRSVIYLTDKGRALPEKVLPPVLELNNAVQKGLTKADVRNLQRMLKIIRTNVASSHAEGKSNSEEDAA